MPVNVLYCEGAKDSPDIRVLLNVLSGVCNIKFSGSKYGLDKRMLFFRYEKLLPDSTVAALKDRDFDNDASLPQNLPRNWLAKDPDNQNKEIQVGWSWERKEIENYLIDPQVVLHALGAKAPPIDDYCNVLNESAKNIADYTAARIALSISRRPIYPLKNCWGKSRGKDQHYFPDCVGELDCRNGIRDIVQQYEQALIREGDVLESFEQLLSECRVGGCRFDNFLTFFSGKDLLYGMRSALIGWNLGEPFAFRARVVKGIEDSTENVYSWLPEWEHLRQAVQNFTP